MSKIGKRIDRELYILNENRMSNYQAVQDEKKKKIFYFLIRGDDDTVYKGGYYIGKIVLPDTYPVKPCSFYMLTPSGRFATDSKICLTNSDYHTEQWSPSWTIQTMIIGFISIFYDDTSTGISHIKESPGERKIKALESMNYNMKHYRDICLLFTQFITPDGDIRTDTEVREYLINLKLEKEKRKREKEKKRKKKQKEKENKTVVANN